MTLSDKSYYVTTNAPVINRKSAGWGWARSDRSDVYLGILREDEIKLDQWMQINSTKQM